MKSFLKYLLAGLILTGCNNQTPDLTEEQLLPDSDREQVQKSPDIAETGLEISEELLRRMEQEIGKPYEILNEEIWKYSRDTEETYLLDSGILFSFVAEDLAHQIFEKYHRDVEIEGNYLFLSKMDFDEGYATYYDIIILKCADQFEVINLMATDGLNYDIFTPDIIDQMKIWHEEVGFEICVVDRDRIHAYMTKKPADIEKFCAEVYEFCPDVIQQGYDSMDAMIADYSENNYFWMWWD